MLLLPRTQVKFTHMIFPVSCDDRIYAPLPRFYKSGTLVEVDNEVGEGAKTMKDKIGEWPVVQKTPEILAQGWVRG